MRDFGMEKINMIEGDQEEKIIRAIERYNESGNSADQLKIVEIIKNENLSLMTSIGKGGTDKDSVLVIILANHLIYM